MRLTLLLPVPWILACGAPPAAQPSDAASDAATQEASSDAGDLVDVTSSCTVPSVPDAGAVSFQSRIAYGPIDQFSDSARDSSQTFDVAWPPGGGTHPLVILIHGGGWSTGDAQYYDDDARILASLGYVAVSLNYRLVTGADGGASMNQFPAATSDVRCALRYLRANASAWGIDGTRVAAMGESAGGHLAAVLAVESEVGALDDGTCPAELAAQPITVNVAIGYYGPYDLLHSSDFQPLASGTASIGIVDAFLGGPMDTSPNAALASPVAHVDSHDAPMLVMHGTMDALIPPNDAPELEGALRAAGVPATWIEITGPGHGFPTIADKAPFLESTCTMLEVLRERLGS
jgi:acetyl esterase/lipase